MTIKHTLRMSSVAASLALGALACPSEAEACGGFFCDSNQPINQAAERIIFAHNPDGTVTAVIQILYEGPAESFSWVLPISSVPTPEEGIGIASDIAFQRLQQATNPTYTLTTRVEGTCGDNNFPTGAPASGSGGASGNPQSPGDGGVVVEASGIVGPFEWTVISVIASVEDPSDVAVTWLTDNGYDVAPGARGLLRDYLAEEGMHLLALRLTKDADTGSIRPIKLTYAAEKPMIPIKLTAVAANADMGVMTWILSSGRAVPSNYNALELNEARINWFNPGLNYNDVVTAAADEAGGQGFVTEFAGPSESLGKPVWSDSDEARWTGFKTSQFASLSQIFQASQQQWGSWDGFWDAVRIFTLPAGVTVADFKLCPECYAGRITFSPSEYIAALEKNVIAPVRDVQKLLDEHAYTTRFYTTMSAEEMTVDPAFTFNVKLPDVSNQHTAERVIECKPTLNRFNAPWRVELPQGVTVRGTGNSWPGDDLEQPANARILRMAETGEGKVLEDNSEVITIKLKEYNAAFGDPPAGTGGTSSGGSMSGGSMSGGRSNGGRTNGGSTSGGSMATAGGDTGEGANSSTTGGAQGAKAAGGCNTVAGAPASGGWLLSLSGFGLFMAARRRRRQ